MTICSGEITGNELRFSPLAASQPRKPDRRTSDSDLIRRIGGGDKAAMHLLYSRHSTRIFRFAARLLGDRAAAEDVVSEVFLAVWRKAGSFEARAEVSTWLLSIARNLAFGAMRRPASEALDDDLADTIEDPAEDPEAHSLTLNTKAIMQKCLAQLSLPQREIVDLVYYHHKSIEEASEIVGVGENTVKTRMHYARKHLANLLAAQGITTTRM